MGGNGAPLIMVRKTDNPVSDAAGIAAAAGRASKKGPPPVHLWNPPFCGDLDMEIRADGTWFYQGSPIGRPAMVRLFASILKREGDEYFLVTPVEKVRIRVVDAPFVAVEMKAEGEGPDARLAFRLNTGDLVTAGPDHPLRFAEDADGPRPYLGVRAGLEALVARSVYYELAERAIAGDDAAPGVWSDGAFFPLPGGA